LGEQAVKISKKHKNVIVIFIATAMAIVTLVQLSRCTANWEAPYSTPPPDLKAKDLTGVWVCQYLGGDEDILIIREDGTFMQTLRVRKTGEILFQTPWNEWHMERFSDGRVRLHLIGARQFVGGPELAEAEKNSPWPYNDPFSDETIWPENELMLNVRTTRQGELVLVQFLRGAADAPYLDLSGKAVRFRREKSDQ